MGGPSNGRELSDAQDHWTERGQAASVSNTDALGRLRRSLLSFRQITSLLINTPSMLAPESFREALLDPRLPGVAYMLVWGELSEGSQGHLALSQVLFDCEAAPSPDDAPTRDLSDASVRQGVYDCAMRYPDVRQACEKVLGEIGAAKTSRPWWKFW